MICGCAEHVHPTHKVPGRLEHMVLDLFCAMNILEHMAVAVPLASGLCLRALKAGLDNCCY